MEGTAMRPTHPGRLPIPLRGAKKTGGFSLLPVSKPAESSQRLLNLDDAKTFHWLPTALK